jgi:hypothetical protein
VRVFLTVPLALAAIFLTGCGSRDTATAKSDVVGAGLVESIFSGAGLTLTESALPTGDQVSRVLLYWSEEQEGSPDLVVAVFRSIEGASASSEAHAGGLAICQEVAEQSRVQNVVLCLTTAADASERADATGAMRELERRVEN